MFKRVASLLFFVAVISVSASGSGIMGPPTAELLEGQWSIGYKYMHSEEDFGTASIKSNDYLNGNFVISDVDNDKIKDFKKDRQYAAFSYGVSDLWEVYFQIGIVASEADLVAESGGKTELDFSRDLALGWGTKITLCEQENIRWGTSLQMNWLDMSAHIKDSSAGYSEKTTYDFETMDLLIAFGPTIDMGGWQLYGGPFYYYMSGDYSEDGWDSDGWTWDAKADLDNESEIGGFIGAQIPLWDNTELVAEVSFTGDSWAVGTGITWKF
jgi:hypothetical protein